MNRMKLIAAALAVILTAGCSGAATEVQSNEQGHNGSPVSANDPEPGDEPAQPGNPSWFHSFAEHDPARWRKASGYSNGAPFDCTWSSSNVEFVEGLMELRLTRHSSRKSCAEYRSLNTFHYGKYEVRMKAAKNIGVVSSFFIYTGPAHGTQWDEIDIEFLGKDTTKVQFNYFTDGQGGNEKIVELGYDASEEFHDYAFEWTPDAIRWYVDGELVHAASENLPVTPANIMMNIWNGINVDSWLGPYDGASPITAQYEWMRFTPLEELQ